MESSFHVQVVAADVVHDIEHGFSDNQDREILEGLLGPQPDDDHPTETLLALIRDSDPLPFAERMLGAVLMEPPIPAYCGTLVMRMQHPETFPWRDHEIAGDRLSLWYAHWLWNRALPDEWPPPEVTRLRLVVTNTSPRARHVGRRMTLRQGSSFVARLLAGKPGSVLADGLGSDTSPGCTWFYDVVWSAAFRGREKLTAEQVAALVPDTHIVAGGRYVQTTLSAWVPTQ